MLGECFKYTWYCLPNTCFVYSALCSNPMFPVVISYYTLRFFHIVNNFFFTEEKQETFTNKMKNLLITFVLILWTETLADQSPGTSILYAYYYYYLGKQTILSLNKPLVNRETRYLFTKKSKHIALSCSWSYAISN